jgi:hypothetical protein
MASKFVELKDAAKMLNVTPEELVEMRSQGEIHGYRDGASWKFKTEEIQRVADERGGDLASDIDAEMPADTADDVDDFDDLLGISDVGAPEAETTSKKADSDVVLSTEDDEDLDEESILVSEEALGHSGDSTSSTIIGKHQLEDLSDDSDIRLALDDGEVDTGGGAIDSDVTLVPDADGSDVHLVAGGSDAFSAASDVLSAADSGVKSPGEDTGRLAASSDLLLAGGSGVSAGESLALGEDDLLLEGGSSASSASASGSAIDFTTDDEDVLSGPGSDLTLGAGDSGINLNPTDSGLSLDESLDLGGGSGVESLELPEDDEVIGFGGIESADPDVATQLKADDQFMLTPSDESDDEQSGSQVIALEDSATFDQDANALGAALQPALVPEETDLFGQPSAGAPMGGAATYPAAAGYGAALPETPYSVWNVILLVMVTLFLIVGGMMMMDLTRNMWAFDGTSVASTPLMDAIVSAFGLSK